MNIEDKASDYIQDEETIQTIPNDQKNDQIPENSILKILKSKTGEGSIESYQDHPLNFKNNKYLGQIIRGMTGIIGSLDLAIIDIVMGLLGYFTDKKKMSTQKVYEDV